jgi:energy-coupling factor transporter transmembrane protein EcfT
MSFQTTELAIKKLSPLISRLFALLFCIWALTTIFPGLIIQAFSRAGLAVNAVFTEEIALRFSFVLLGNMIGLVLLTIFISSVFPDISELLSLFKHVFKKLFRQAGTDTIN